MAGHCAVQGGLSPLPQRCMEVGANEQGCFLRWNQMCWKKPLLQQEAFVNFSSLLREFLL